MQTLSEVGSEEVGGRWGRRGSEAREEDGNGRFCSAFENLSFGTKAVSEISV